MDTIKLNHNLDPLFLETLGEIDHNIVDAPYLRLTKSLTGEHGDTVYIWDLRFKQPNQEHIQMTAVHSLEHMIAVFLPNHVPAVIHFGPMGCQTGFYLITFNFCNYDTLLNAIADTLNDCLVATEVPLANTTQCGWAKNHTLLGAQEIARQVLANKENWPKILS